ncbi:MAG: biopolymer transporter ExbD, partial [candidate division KSB1 bacterium]|nr:biopolymer transporter ExbD [candidate division KSB1 bacterium]
RLNLWEGSERAMSRGGMIVRFIDLVMILLFGFICSSELSQQSKIVLAKSWELPPTTPDPEIVVFVGITKDGNYWFDEERRNTPDLQELEQFLLARKNELMSLRHKMRVRLRANHDTPIRFVMRAADLCDRLEVAKSVDVRMATKLRG